MKDTLNFDWKRSSWRFEPWEGLLFVTGWSLDSEHGFRTGCRNVSHKQQSFSGLQSPRWSFSIKVCYSWVQSIFLWKIYCCINVFTLSLKTMTLNLERNLILPFWRLETKVPITRATRLFSSFKQWNYGFKFGLFRCRCRRLNSLLSQRPNEIFWKETNKQNNNNKNTNISHV